MGFRQLIYWAVIGSLQRNESLMLHRYGIWLAIVLLVFFVIGVVGFSASVTYSQDSARPESVKQLEGPIQRRVVDVQITGNRTMNRSQVMRSLKTRPGSIFREDIVEQDVRELYRSRAFIQVRTSTRPAPQGVIVIFDVLERPVYQHVQFLGNKNASDASLLDKTGLKKGDPVSPHDVNLGREKIEKHYREKGYNRVQVSVLSGTRASDAGVRYLISEGPRQRIRWTSFVGNTIVSDGRLRTQVQSKPGIGWLISGFIDRKKIEEDIERLTAYYRSLGYMRALVSRDIEVSADRDWATLIFYISEGPRYTIRKISFSGNEKISSAKLTKAMKLTQGGFFKQTDLGEDTKALRDLYGGFGHIEATVTADLRYLDADADNPDAAGELDLVYDINEGKVFRVGKIFVNIRGPGGTNQPTRRQVVLNRLSLSPGDIIDIRQIRDSERRLQASQLFLVSPQTGVQPKISFHKPRGTNTATAGKNAPRRQTRFRGQNPDSFSGKTVDLWIDLTHVPPKPKRYEHNRYQAPQPMRRR